MANQNTSVRRKLFSNFSSLLVLQAANYIFPLITFPYLVRVLGPEKFGLINFAAAFTAYFNILTDYGFNLSATREISLNREDTTSISRIFSAVLIIKTLLAIISFGIFLGIIYLTDFGYSAELYLLSFGTVVGSVLFPVWFFQGMEQMKYITILNVASKFIATLSIFLTVYVPSDYLTAVGIYSSLSVITGIASLVLAIRYFNISFHYPGSKEISYHLRQGWHLFISSVAINLYTTSTIFILGLFAGNTVVGHFAAADKIRLAFQGIISTISQTIFPHISNRIKASVQESIQFLKTMFILTSSVGFILSLVLFSFSEQIISIVLGPKYGPSAGILEAISWIIFLVSISNVLGVQMMINFGRKSIFTKIIIAGAVINLLISFILIPQYLQFGSCISVLITECFISGAMIYYVLVNKKDILSYQYV